MNIVQLFDVNAIQSIMMHSDIIGTITDDTWDGTPYMPDIEKEVYLGCVVEGQLVGVMALHWFTGTTLQGHIHVLKVARKQHARKFLHECIKWIVKNIRRCKKVACFIPFVYPNVKHFVAGCGLELEGELRNAYSLNNELHDMWVMGMGYDKMLELANG